MGAQIYLSLLLFTNIAYSSKLPSDFQICKRSDPHINECLRSAIQGAFKRMANGIKELNVVSLEPLVVPSLTIGAGKGSVHVEQKYKDVHIHNMSTSSVDKTEATIGDTVILRSEISSPQFMFKSNYDFNGDVKGILTVTAEKFEKKGKVYLKATDFTVTLTPGKAHFNFENLFNGDQRLGKEMNNILNENWKEVYQDVGPGYEQFLASIGKHISNSVFSKVPFDELMPL